MATSKVFKWGLVRRGALPLLSLLNLRWSMDLYEYFAIYN